MNPQDILVGLVTIQYEHDQNVAFIQLLVDVSYKLPSEKLSDDALSVFIAFTARFDMNMSVKLLLMPQVLNTRDYVACVQSVLAIWEQGT
jgi:hypothetical protein